MTDNAKSKSPLVIRPGEYAVIKGYYDHEVVEVIRTTAQTLFHKVHWTTREKRTAIENVRFSGPREAAERLGQQLQSSRAQLSDDERRARERRRERDEQFVRAALDALNTSGAPQQDEAAMVHSVPTT